MLRSLLFLLALALAAASLLTFIKAPNIPLWMVGILVGEFGHWLIVLIVLLGLLTAVAVPAGFFRQLILCVFFFTALILAKPTVQAYFAGQSLPAKLTRVFGDVPMDHTPLQFDRLFGMRNPTKVDVKTEAFAYFGTPDELSLDFYPAAGVNDKPVPCVIVIHGGGWDNGSRDELPNLNHYLARHGYAVASISYRLAPKFVWPAQREDILTAIAFLKTHAEGYNIDPTRLVLLGRSAGGNLAESVGYAAKDPAIRGIIAFYAPADLNFAWTYGRDDDILKSTQLLQQFLGGAPKTARLNYDETSPYDFVDKATPPTLLLHGTLDALVWSKQSERLDVRLSRNNVPHFFLSLPWATHAFDFNLRGPGGQLSTYAIEHFLAAVTKEGGFVSPKGAGAETPAGKGKTPSSKDDRSKKKR
jgi:acetyl esterase/lipase